MAFPILGKVLDGFVHQAAADDDLRALRHRSFIAAHFGLALVALAILPLSLAAIGPVSLAQVAIFAWLVLPLAVAFYLSRTGRLETAHFLSAAVLTGLIVWLAATTGGHRSVVLVWLAVVPFEAALSGSRRVTGAAAGIAILGFFGLVGAEWVGLLVARSADNTWLSAVAIPAAILYAGGIAVRLESIARDFARAARRGEERYRLLADHATDMITRHAANGDVEFASPAARSLTGLRTDELLGDGLFGCIHLADRPAYLKALSVAFNSGKPVSVEFRLRCRDADDPARETFVDVEMGCRPATDPLGTTRAVVAVTRDISRRKVRDAELLRMRETAERANLAKSHFLAHMSHELRTPLNAIIGFSQILEQDPVAPPDAVRLREYARLIHESGDHLLEVVNGILDMSKIESGMFDLAVERFAVVPLIESCREMLAHQAEREGVLLTVNMPAETPDIVADRRACRQMLINLMSNAIKFSDRRGAVSVGARWDRHHVFIAVRDEGIGISDADLTRIGTPFVQVDSTYHRRFAGTGLGLSMVKGLAALHGGRLEIESRLGAGTTATIVLPLRGPFSAGRRDSVKPAGNSSASEIMERKSA
ncbi:MAG: PAS domain-containing sensor histidine kinase [Bauldia sp.]